MFATELAERNAEKLPVGPPFKPPAVYLGKREISPLAVSDANAEIITNGQGAATTIVGAVETSPNHFDVFNLGDSRAYRINRQTGKMDLLTRDHVEIQTSRKLLPEPWVTTLRIFIEQIFLFRKMNFFCSVLMVFLIMSIKVTLPPTKLNLFLIISLLIPPPSP